MKYYYGTITNAKNLEIEKIIPIVFPKNIIAMEYECNVCKQRCGQRICNCCSDGDYFYDLNISIENLNKNFNLLMKKFKEELFETIDEYKRYEDIYTLLNFQSIANDIVDKNYEDINYHKECLRKRFYDNEYTLNAFVKFTRTRKLNKNDIENLDLDLKFLYKHYEDSLKDVEEYIEYYSSKEDTYKFIFSVLEEDDLTCEKKIIIDGVSVNVSIELITDKREAYFEGPYVGKPVIDRNGVCHFEECDDSDLDMI